MFALSAPHRNLEQMVAEGTFEQDLFYRLNVYPIKTPALRERRSDIPHLAQHFLERYRREFGVEVRGFDDGALATLTAHDWPGNVRELQNEIQRVLIHGVTDRVPTNALSDRVRGKGAHPTSWLTQ